MIDQATLGLHPEMDAIEHRVRQELGTRSYTTADRDVFDMIQRVAQEGGITPILVNIPANGFDAKKELKKIIEEGAGQEKVAFLQEKYGPHWFEDEVEPSGRLEDYGIDASTFSVFIDVAPDVSLRDRQYDQFSNNLRYFIQKNQTLQAVIYAPTRELIHEELQRFSTPLFKDAIKE